MAAHPVRVRLADGAESGLANIVRQYLEQSLDESEPRRQRARKLRGRVAMTAADHGIAVTLEFTGDEIVISDGAREPLDASIAGPYQSLLGLLQGEGNALVEHLRGRLRVRSSLRKPFFPLQVQRLMQLPSDRADRRRARYAVAAGVVAGVAAAVFLLLRS